MTCQGIRTQVTNTVLFRPIKIHILNDHVTLPIQDSSFIRLIANWAAESGGCIMTSSICLQIYKVSLIVFNVTEL